MSPATYSPLPLPLGRGTVRVFATGVTTTPSADFCSGLRLPRGSLSRESATQNRSPEVSSTAFHAQPSDLRFALTLLLHASFRPRLAATPLRFANPSPPSGWVEDFHFQTAEHARHTTLGSGELKFRRCCRRRAPPQKSSHSRLLRVSIEITC
jgi:hypothetical protein